MHVGRREGHDQQDALLIDEQVVLGARLAPIRQVRPGLRAPFLAGMLALSRPARPQSIWSARPRRFNSTWCSRFQSRRRRQQVTPLPQPISWGSISHGIPVFNTKMIPASAARSGTRSRPPLGFGGSGDSSGWITSHSSSLTNDLLVIGQHTQTLQRF